MIEGLRSLLGLNRKKDREPRGSIIESIDPLNWDVSDTGLFSEEELKEIKDSNPDEFFKQIMSRGDGYLDPNFKTVLDVIQEFGKHGDYSRAALLARNLANDYAIGESHLLMRFGREDMELLLFPSEGIDDKIESKNREFWNR